jgi:ATP-dependent RNA helicase SUPV3L1/SUV3
MSLFSPRQTPAPQPAVNTPSSPKSANAHPLDALTGGVFSAATASERATRVRDWLATDPSAEHMNEVFKELSQRDRGAAKPLKEKLDELKRQKSQEQAGAEWAAKAEGLLAASRLNLADALAWQRDAARAGAPLSREPLATLRQQLAERIKSIEDLQHAVQVEREAAVLIAQRIEVLSTKPWRDARQAADALRADVAQWQQQIGGLTQDAQWASVEAKFPPMLEASRQQLQLVWDAFDAALAQAVAADSDTSAPLPAVPVWADELRAARGVPPAEQQAANEQAQQAQQARRERAGADVEKAVAALEAEVAQGHGKATPKAAADLRQLLKQHGRLIGQALEARAHAVLSQAGELEGWQRWRADQLREELVSKAEALTQAPEGQRPSGRKLQEAIRQLREQWKTTDQGGAPNHALWKRFDEACTEAHKGVEAWLAQVRQQSEATRAQRQVIIDELKAWTEAHAQSSDWKAQLRELHAFSERWRQAGHLSEKAFAEVQPIWKDAMHQAHARLEAAQAESVARRKALIDEAGALSQAQPLRIDAVKALQQRWQAEAHAVPLDRKQEQKLWEAFRSPIDAAFERKTSERQQQAGAVSAVDQRVLDASRELEAATQSGDAQRIRAAMAALEAAGRAAPPAAAPAAAASDGSAAAEGAPTAAEGADTTPAKSAPEAAPRKLVAMRGDDRPGAKKSEPASRDVRRDGRPGRPDARGGRDGRDFRDGRDSRDRRDFRDDREPRGPRLGDTAFRAQRQAMEAAQSSLRRLAEQAHGEVLTQVLDAWQARDAEQLPAAQALGGRVAPAQRTAWAAALGQPAGNPSAEALLRLEIAAEAPTPAEHLSERRLLQLQLLTRRNAPSPAETWAQDVAQVLAGAHDEKSARRLQATLKTLLKR